VRPADLDALRKRTNALVYVSAGAGAAALTLGAVAFVDGGPVLGWSWRW